MVCMGLGWMEGTDESPELWRHPNFSDFLGYFENCQCKITAVILFGQR